MSANVLWGVCDCETDSFDYSGENVEPFIWGILDSDGNYNVFWNTLEFVGFVRTSGIKYLYGHNAGKFDFMFSDILRDLGDGKIMLINSRLAKAKIGNTELRDSFLCLPAPLAKFGEKDDFDYSMLAREKKRKRGTEFKAKIEKYLKQDCVALFNAMERFILQYGFALTQAGASMATWEKMGGEERRYGAAHDANFRKFYFGGRCEVLSYHNGTKGNFQLYDINSSYPFAMTLEHPVGTDYYGSANWRQAPDASFWTIYGVSRGALPLKTTKGTTFPNSHLPNTFNCTGWELNAGLETGTLDVISADGLIPRRFESMRTYVEKYYQDRIAAKKAGDTIGDLLAKIFMNSLYGRYGMNSEEFRDYKIIEAGAPMGEWSPYMFCGDFEIVQREAINKTFYDVALSASVTGCARAKLWRAICSSKNPIYCDTDSILCDEFTGETGDKLGQWKFEGEFAEIWIAGKKCYAFKNSEGEYKTAHKGISKLDIDVEDIKRAAAGEIVEIMKSAPNMKMDGRQVFFSRRIRKT